MLDTHESVVADLERRSLLRSGALLAMAASPLAALAAAGTGEGVSFADGPRPLVKYPGKRPLIRVHTRPPHLETPFAVFNEGPSPRTTHSLCATTWPTSRWRWIWPPTA